MNNLSKSPIRFINSSHYTNSPLYNEMCPYKMELLLSISPRYPILPTLTYFPPILPSSTISTFFPTSKKPRCRLRSPILGHDLNIICNNLRNHFSGAKLHGIRQACIAGLCGGWAMGIALFGMAFLAVFLAK
jgi:nitrate reductase beta subunit